jgi:hypothetical protein
MSGHVRAHHVTLLLVAVPDGVLAVNNANDNSLLALFTGPAAWWLSCLIASELFMQALHGVQNKYLPCVCPGKGATLLCQFCT